MYDYDYKIMMDRNGEPYICHAGLFGDGNKKGSQKKDHKYYARIQERKGYRYFYSPEELKAYYNQTVNSVKDATGVNARKQVNEAREKLQNANFFNRKRRERELAEAQERYADTLQGKAERAASKASSKAKEYANKPVAALKDVVQDVRSRKQTKVSNGLNSSSEREEKFASKKTEPTKSAIASHEVEHEPTGKKQAKNAEALDTARAREEKLASRRSQATENKTTEGLSTNSERDEKFASQRAQVAANRTTEGLSTNSARNEKFATKDNESTKPAITNREVEHESTGKKQAKNAEALDSASAREEKIASQKNETSEEKSNGTHSKKVEPHNSLASSKEADQEAEPEKEKKIPVVGQESFEDRSEEKAASKAETKASNKEESASESKSVSNQNDSDEEAIKDIRRIAANSDKSLSTEERQRLGEQYGLDEKTLNIIDGNLRHPDMQGPRGQKWIDDFIRKNMKKPETESNKTTEIKDKTTDNSVKASKKEDDNANVKASGSYSKSSNSNNETSLSSSKSKIDASKVSVDYVMKQAEAKGLDSGSLQAADSAYYKAQQAYNKVLNNHSSSQERAAAQRKMDKVKQAYDSELQKLVDELNK